MHSKDCCYQLLTAFILRKTEKRPNLTQTFFDWDEKISAFKAAYSVTMNIFRKQKYFLFKSFAKVEKSYVVTINLISTVENCMKK